MVLTGWTTQKWTSQKSRVLLNQDLVVSTLENENQSKYWKCFYIFSLTIFLFFGLSTLFLTRWIGIHTRRHTKPHVIIKTVAKKNSLFNLLHLTERVSKTPTHLERVWAISSKVCTYVLVTMRCIWDPWKKQKTPAPPPPRCMVKEFLRVVRWEGKVGSEREK